MAFPLPTTVVNGQTGHDQHHADLHSFADAIRGAADTALAITNTTTNAALKITQTGATSNSTSVGGAINLTNTANTGAGLVIYSNQGALGTGRLLSVRSDNAAFTQDVVNITASGTGAALGISHAGTGQSIVVNANAAAPTAWAVTINQNATSGAGAGALNLTNDNPASSTLNVAGVEVGFGTVKIGHTGTGADTGASALSIDLQGEGTVCSGIFLKSSTTSGTTGDLLTLRNPNLDMLIVHSNGRIKFANSANHATTVGASGTATAPPAQPKGYLLCEDNAGSTIRIPYYN